MKALLDIACSLIIAKGWNKFEVSDIATEAGISLVDVYAIFPSKTSFLIALTQKIDTDVIAQGMVEGRHDPPRDRLFDILMRRFEALRPYHKVLSVVTQEWSKDPFSTLASSPQFLRSMSWMLRLAYLNSNTFKGRLLLTRISILFVKVFRVWLKDESPDMTQTMAELDQRLRKLKIE